MEENQNGFQPEQSEQDVNAIPEQDAEENAQPAEVEAPEAETAEQSTQEASEETAQPTAAPEKQPKKKAALGIALAAVVAVLAVAAIFITQAIKNKNLPDEIDPDFSQSADVETPAQDPEQTPEETPEETPAETKPITGVIAHRNAQGYASYTMTAEQATDEVLDLVVANCGDWALDNRGLAYYYWEQYYSLAGQYGQYLSYLMDTSLGLDEQLYNDYPGIMAMLKQAVEDMHKFQDEQTGMFWQVIDHPEAEGNYLETSGTALFAYAVLKGVRLGYLPKRMAAWAEKAFYGTCDRYLSKNPDGSLQLDGICLVAGLGGKDHRDGSLAYYFSEPVVCNDAKGVGPLVLAYTEMIARK